MELHVYWAFVVATAIMIALPGPSVLLTVAHSVSFGWKRALSTVGGATVGIAAQLIVAAIGLASLLHTVSQAFGVLRWGGAVYLVYLGFKQWRSAADSLNVESSVTSGKNLFVQGLVVTIPNPKSLIFIAAFLPQFVDETHPVAAQLSIIVPSFLVITFVVTACWAFFAGKIRGIFGEENSVKTGLLRSSGVLMIAAGLGLALVRRGN